MISPIIVILFVRVQLYMATFEQQPDFGKINVTVRLGSGAEVRLSIAKTASMKQLKQDIVTLERADAAVPIGPSCCMQSEVPEFLAKLQLQQHEAALLALGATAMQHLRRVTDADLAAAGLQPLERQRLLAALVAQPVSVTLPEAEGSAARALLLKLRPDCLTSVLRSESAELPLPD